MKKEQDLWNLLSIVLFLAVFLLMGNYLLAKNPSIVTKTRVFDLFIISVATFRMIRLFAKDKVTSFLRDFFSGIKKGPGRTVHEILVCPWCVGIWAALISIFLYYLNPLGKIFVFVIAIAGVGSFLQVNADIAKKIWNKKSVKS